MNIKRLKVEKFKKFDDLDIEFRDGVNLFVGVNGSGKTSLLEAINVAVGAFFGSQESKMQQLISFDDIRIKGGHRAETASVEAKSDDIDGYWKRTIKRDTKTNDSKDIRKASDYGQAFFKAFEVEGDKTVAPIIAYYSTQRLFSDAKHSKYQQYDASIGRKNGYLQALKSEAIKTVLHEWLHNADYRRYSMEKAGLKDDNLAFENIVGVIKNIVGRFWRVGKSEEVKLYFDPDNYGKIPLLVYGERSAIPFTGLSDGLRNLLYLVIDLVWRASQLNPFLSLAEISEKVNGVVTIDEIDLHLHPSWQANVIGELQLLFPRVQFFITTHSPIVVANFENGTLYTIKDAAVEVYDRPYFGRSVEDIIREVLEARPRNKATEEKIGRLLVAIDEGDEEKYAPLLKELEEQLGAYESEIIRAKALIDWKNSPD